MEKDNFSENGGDNELAKAWEGMGQEFEEEGREQLDDQKEKRHIMSS